MSHGFELHEESVDDEDDSRWLRAIMRFGVLRRKANWRAFHGWVFCTTMSRTLNGMSSRVQALTRRGRVRKAWLAWIEYVEWWLDVKAASVRVQRKHVRLYRAAVLSSWRYIVHWRKRWVIIAPCIVRRWRVAVLRDVTSSWHHAVLRLRALRVSVDAFQRRRKTCLFTYHVLEWSRTATLISTRTKILQTSRVRSMTAALRIYFFSWSDVCEKARCSAHAAAVVCRRRGMALSCDAYHRWSDWSYTSRQHRRAAIRALDRMRMSAAAACGGGAHSSVGAHERASDTHLGAVCHEMKGLGSRLREHMERALSHAISRSSTRLLRLILREWSCLRREKVRLKEMAGCLLVRCRIKICASVLQVWNEVLDRKSFFAVVHKRIRRRRVATLLYICATTWHHFSLRAQRFRNRLRRLERRVLLRTYTRFLRHWQTLSEDMKDSRLVLSRLIRRSAALDFVGA